VLFLQQQTVVIVPFLLYSKIAGYF